MELDDRLTVPGAEGIDLHLSLAGIGSRSAALLVDVIIQFLALAAFTLVATSFGEAGAAAAAIGAFAIVIGYHLLFEAFNDGRTPGKALLRIAAVSADGTPLTFWQSVVRNVVRFIDLLPGTYLVGMVAVLATAKSQRLGDLAAGTVVVHRATASAEVPSVAWTAPASSTVPSFGGGAGAPPSTWDLSAVSAEEVAAARAFLTRRQALDPAHRASIAQALGSQLATKVAGVPLDGGPEAFLERVVAAKGSR